MAKIRAKMGKVTWTDSNGRVIEFEPSEVTITQNAQDKYYSLNDISVGCYVPRYTTDINISGTYLHDLAQTKSTPVTYGYKEIRENSKMKISMQWLKPNQLNNTDLGPGMLFLYENRSSIFGNEAEVVANITAMVINGAVPREIDFDDYAGGLLVTGFDVPREGHPLLNVPLKPAIHHRGTVAQNNPRTIYEYMSDETYGLGLYVGLTVHDVLGSWSSWPVHEYEINALTAPIGLYPDFSEKFAFITQPMGNWGLQARSQANGEKSVLKFRDNDIIDIPLGAHPSVAGPATRLAYFWAYSGAPRKDF